ncbi:scarecrow-like protein 14 [Tanacetum coccineum]
MSSSVDNRPRPIDTGEIIFSSSGRHVEDDYFDGVFVYLNKMLMEEDDLSNKPFMLIDSLALQATEKSFYNVLVEDHCSIQETELLKIYDTTLLCEDEITHLWPLHNPCWGSFHGIPNGSRKKKRRKMVVEVVDLTELLTRCAQKVASFETTAAIEILKTIRKHSSPKGSSSERMAHYFANAIEARLRGRGTQVYRGVSTANVSAVDILKSYKTYITACPFQRM